ncbi:MAG: hypothetical protein ACJAVS_001705 [Paracoccaceae bacterium]|jgi:hypothetical protein
MEEIEQHATQLYDAIGPRAIATAAQRARTAEETGASGEAAAWRKIETRLLEMRGPRQS